MCVCVMHHECDSEDDSALDDATEFKKIKPFKRVLRAEERSCQMSENQQCKCHDDVRKICIDRKSVPDKITITNRYEMDG